MMEENPVREEMKRMSEQMIDPREIIYQQLELLAEISKKESTTTEQIVECSKVMAILFNELTH
jgi:hypothetical protein